MEIHRRYLLVLAAALAAREATATSLRPGNLQSDLLVSEGKTLFCQPDESFTILDLETGQPLVRDTGTRCEGRLRLTDHGPLLSTHWGRHRMIDIAQSIAKGRLVARWEIGSATRGCRSSRVIDDQFICARADDFVVQSRSLADGVVRWSYEAPGAVMDIVPRDGKLLLQSGDYRLARHLSVVELGSGRRLFEEAVVQDASFQVRSFDGRQVELEARPPEGSDCRGVIVRTLSPVAGRLVARDACGEPAPPWKPPLEPPRGTALRFKAAGSGKWIEGVRGGESWFAYRRGAWPALAKVYQGGGVVVIENAKRSIAFLECIDARSGHPKWLYVYNPFREPSPDWESAKARPPLGTVPATAPRSTEDDEEADHAAYDRVPYPAPVTFDPAPMREESRQTPLVP